MRYFLGLALATFIAVSWLGFTGLTSGAKQDLGEDYATYLWQVHGQEQPLPTGLLSQSPPPEAAVAGEMVTYGQLEGQPLQGYLARPAGKSGPLPAVIVIHEWWGLNDNIKMMARQLGSQGYTALAVDLYEGQVAGEPKQARELVTQAMKRPERLKANLREAYQYLDGQQATKIAAIGWCFGGTWALNTALLFPDQLDGAVIYYGGQLETNPARLAPLKMPILGIFGELDQNPSVETVRQFEAALKGLGKTVEVHIYPNAGHAFANPSGERYKPEAAADAWRRTREFLAKYLK